MKFFIFGFIGLCILAAIGTFIFCHPSELWAVSVKAAKSGNEIAIADSQSGDSPMIFFLIAFLGAMLGAMLAWR